MYDKGSLLIGKIAPAKLVSVNRFNCVLAFAPKASRASEPTEARLSIYFRVGLTDKPQRVRRASKSSEVLR
jgi:hypothetical protein